MKRKKHGKNCQKAVAIDDSKNGLLVHQRFVDLESQLYQNFLVSRLNFGAKYQPTIPYKRSVGKGLVCEGLEVFLVAALSWGVW